jgi:hypothetical protein
MLNRTSCFLILAAAVLSSCGSDSTKNEVATADTSTASPIKSKELQKAQQILYTLPSPAEAAALMKNSGASFDLSVLNPTGNVSKYGSNERKALNLGVYGTDLIYANIFEQTQESSEYFKCANTLATALGINDIFGEATYNRVKKNMQNRDSLMSIIAEASLDADSYFKENERPAASALVAVGGWIEGLYIATSIAGKTKSDAIVQRVAEQKNSLNNLVGLVESFGSEKELVSILSDLKEIKALFDVLDVKKTAPAKAASSGTEAPTIGISRHVNITPEQLKAISEKVATIRNKITQ